jgi:hypothetical protein
VIPRSRSALSLSRTQAYLKEALPIFFFFFFFWGHANKLREGCRTIKAHCDKEVVVVVVVVVVIVGELE